MLTAMLVCLHTWAIAGNERLLWLLRADAQSNKWEMNEHRGGC